MTALLDATGITKRFDGTGVVLDDVAVAVDEGEILAVLGPNGAGKTIMMSILAGSEPPSDGAVSLDGRPIQSSSIDVSFLLQNTMAIDTLTGRENITFYSRLHPRFTARWEEYAEAFEIVDDLDTPVGEYSGGMRRKLELVIALSIDATIYFLDEPTAALDMGMVQKLHSIIRSLRSDGATFVVSSHLPSDIEVADRLLFLRDGQVTSTGDAETLLAELPSVVRIPEVALSETLRSNLVDGRTFDDGEEVRGFVSPDSTVEAITETSCDGGSAAVSSIETVEPTFTDLFNYYSRSRRP
ncbi:ABC-type multidrug transport system, ATPase component [Halovivax ruber XH-70]|uniref:ABC-type multidrug transport system, ATPase component n=1 Tax=Halovivax ruber (strain DSM 18193 / JCM 13892 / XH-70) TaxID=797302 RepID=L0IFJ1_HALRX|nr:ABC transporter ATP-binding protein [Halovivax ruber]AGB17613.1 ABC-type multidrug transport system, ATPase component [Halovivax ruber XH-70]